jgi:hypothetical protein
MKAKCESKRDELFPQKQRIFAPNKFWNLYEQQNLKKTTNKAQQAISHLKSEDEGQVAFLCATSFIIIALYQIRTRDWMANLTGYYPGSQIPN